MSDTHEEHRRKLRQLRVEGEDWFTRRDQAIRLARTDGMSLRDIGGEIGLSATGVQKIVNETRVQDGGSSA